MCAFPEEIVVVLEFDEGVVVMRDARGTLNNFFVIADVVKNNAWIIDDITNDVRVATTVSTLRRTTVAPSP